MARNVTSRVRINRMAIRKLGKAQVTALEKTAEALHAEVIQAQVVPRDTGALQNENFFVDYSNSKIGHVALVFSTPYARRAYYHPEFNFSKDENPNAKGKWLEDWVDGPKKNFCKDTYKEFYRMESGL